MDLYDENTKSHIAKLKLMYNGLKIGFTCSCFDLLHAGHIKMLKDAKNQCDILIVGLQTDPTIDRKTKNKPIQSFEERNIMINAVKYVDKIIYYATEHDLLNILKQLDPDIRILGTDWKDKLFTGHQLPINIHWHIRDHSWSTSNLRKRITHATLSQKDLTCN